MNIFIRSEYLFEILFETSQVVQSKGTYILKKALLKLDTQFVFLLFLATGQLSEVGKFVKSGQSFSSFSIFLNSYCFEFSLI